MNITHLEPLVYDYSQIADANMRTLAQRAADEIKPRLRRATEDILIIGQRLAVVRQYLPHGQWMAWVEAEFGMDYQTAHNFTRVADRFGDKSINFINLKPSALYMLAAPSTPDEAIAEVESLVTNGYTPTVAETKQIITTVRAGLVPAPVVPAPGKLLVDWTDEDWAAAKEKEGGHKATPQQVHTQTGPRPYYETTPQQRQSDDKNDLSPETQRERRIAQAQSLPARTYNVILADPPWQYNNTGVNGAAANHYNTMSLGQLGGLLRTLEMEIADNAVLFLWVTNPMLADAFDLINNWGFTYKTNMVWVKDRVGTGFYVRGMHELLLICTKGAMTPINMSITPPITSVISAPTQEHSRKPDQVHDLIERLYPNCNYIELFARRQRAGWDVWGNEVNQ